MRSSVLALFAIVLGCGVAFGTATAWVSGRDGQVLFRPVLSLNGAVDPRVDSLEIVECVDEDDGMRVTGRVVPGPSPRVILVTGSGSAALWGGVRVGMAFAAETKPESHVGDFSVVLPWADPSSSFALAGSTSGSQDPHGPEATCPGP